MADKTKIEWTDATWNPIIGCQVVSAGCKNCYAMKLAGTRLKHHPTREGLTVETKNGPVWNGQVRFNENALDQPLRWKKPRMIFVCAHSDLFYENVPTSWVDKVFEVMLRCPQHQFQILTKRPDRMKQYVGLWKPASNIWLGTSVENQKTANERIPHLLQTPAAVRWLSCEPLLGPVDLNQTNKFGPNQIDAEIDWVVVGGESGINARPMNPFWVNSLQAQCSASAIPFHFKQWGEWVGEFHEAFDKEKQITDRFVTIYETAHGWDYTGVYCSRVGKRVAGRVLNGVTYDEWPGHYEDEK